MNVLLIESDATDARTFSMFLREQGHLAFITDSAKSAKNLVKKECPGLVLLHVNGNESQAVDFLQSAQEMEPPVPVIVLTRKPRLDDAIRAVKNGAYDFWTKPFPLERLSKAIELIERSGVKEREVPVRTDPDDPIIFVVAMTFTSTAMGIRPPSRSTSLSWSTRRSFA